MHRQGTGRVNRNIKFHRKETDFRNKTIALARALQQEEADEDYIFFGKPEVASIY